jgi:hypothetical protein
VSQRLLFSQPALQAIRAHTLLIGDEGGLCNSGQLKLALLRMSELEGASFRTPIALPLWPCAIEAMARRMRRAGERLRACPADTSNVGNS